MLEWIKDHLGITIGIAFAIILTIFLTAALTTQTSTGSVMSKEWTRSISVEDFDWRHHSKSSTSYISVPAGARNVFHSTPRSKNKDSSGNETTKTTYRVTYEIEEWGYEREVITSGSSSTIAEPFWATDLNLAYNEREGSRQEKYVVMFKFESGKVKKYKTSSFEDYLKIKDTQAYKCEINAFGIIRSVLY